MNENQRQIPLSDLEKILANERARIPTVIGDQRPNIRAREAIDNIAAAVESEFGVSLSIGRPIEEFRKSSIPSETTR